MRNFFLLCGLILCASFLLAQSIIFPGPTAFVPGASSGVPTSGLQLWFAADCITKSGTCSTPSDGSGVTTWADQSTNSNTATANSGTLTFNTAQINGKPAVTCNANCGMLLTSTIAAGSAYSAFAVSKVTSLAFTNGLYVIVGCHSVGSCFLYGPAASQRNMIAHGNFGTLASGTATPNTTWHQTNGVITANSSYIFRIDRTADGSGAPSSGTFSDPIGALFRDENGNSASFAGQIAELLVYNRAVSGAETTQIETYLNGRYGL